MQSAEGLCDHPGWNTYLLTGIYFMIFGPRIVTTHLQTFLYLFLGSHILTTVLCIIIFVTKSAERPRRLFPLDLKDLKYLKQFLVAIFGVYPFCMLCGAVLFFAMIVNDNCDGPRCQAAQLLAGHFGFAGTLSFSAFWMGNAAIWLNLLCYIYRPYVPPENEQKQA